MAPALRLIIDAGNSHVKSICDNQQVTFPHAFAAVMPHDYDDGLNRYGRANAFDFVRINGQSYIVGATAEHYHQQRLTGAPKYARDYYGVLFASTVARIFHVNPDLLKGGLNVVASHASRDYEFHNLLRDAIRGQWAFECGGKRYKFSVPSVETYEECFGSYARCAFVKDKRNQWTTPLVGKVVGILDIGGGTVGTMMVDARGTVQYGASASGNQGFNHVVERLRTLLKKDFVKLFSRAVEIPDDRLRAALVTGKYTGGGRSIDVKQQVQLALNPLLNEIGQLYSANLGGGIGLDIMMLTGGGNAIVGPTVETILNHGDTWYAGTKEDIQFANVLGMKTFWEVLSEEGL